MRPARGLQAVVLGGVLGATVCAPAMARSSGCAGRSRPPGRPLRVGVKIYERHGDVQRLFADFADLGFNTLFVSEALAGDREFRELARRNSMAVFLIEPVFQAPDELKERPDLFAVTDAGTPARDDWVAFACPTREEYRRSRAEAIARAASRLEPDGLSLDFIRYFAYWERVGPERTYESLPRTCYCPTCLECFSRESGLRLPSDGRAPAQAAVWIEANHLEAWTRWKCQVISSMVEDVTGRVRAARPGLQINLHAVPWRRDDFGGALRKVVAQDLPTLSRMTDFVSPMCYSAMLRRKPSWIASVVKDFAGQSSSPVLPSIQVKEYYPGDRTLDAAEFEACLRAALEPPSAGVVFWSWDLIDKAPQNRRVIERLSSSWK
jgi:hypothetical protein